MEAESIYLLLALDLREYLLNFYEYIIKNNDMYVFSLHNYINFSAFLKLFINKYWSKSDRPKEYQTYFDK